MTCRILEDKVFEDPAVAGILSSNFIEARLHTDGPKEPYLKVNHELQARYATSVANPWLVIVDPVSGERLAERGFGRKADIVEFLNSVL